MTQNNFLEQLRDIDRENLSPALKILRKMDIMIIYLYEQNDILKQQKEKIECLNQDMLTSKNDIREARSEHKKLKSNLNTIIATASVFTGLIMGGLLWFASQIAGHIWPHK